MPIGVRGGVGRGGWGVVSVSRGSASAWGWGAWMLENTAPSKSYKLARDFCHKLHIAALRRVTCGRNNNVFVTCIFQTFQT